MFKTPIDIVNRALQHCAMARIGSLTDTSPNAQEVAFVYDKVRRAELRRNVWRFATRRVVLRPIDITTYYLVPAPWGAAGIYIVGSIVAYKGLVYLALLGSTGAAPDANPAIWTLYFGAMTVPPFLPATLAAGQTGPTSGGYWAGELVYTPTGNLAKVYMSLTSANSDVPNVVPAWKAATVYNIGDTVGIVSALHFDPGQKPVFFDPGHVAVSFQALWQSITDMNVGNATTDTTHWIALPIPSQPDHRTGQNWLQLDCVVKAIVTPYPLGAGPVTQQQTRNAFLLPNGYLRQAPSDPKAGSHSWLGAPSGGDYDDWVFEGNFIVSESVDPVMLRFVADIADVTMMDDMFCEGLAARCGKEVAPILIPDQKLSATKQALIERAYHDLMSEARLVNAIEAGSVEAALDDWITCRL